MTLVSDLASNHDSIPSPQCALGTTPHLSIRKKAREGRETKERRERRSRKKDVREKTAKDVKNDQGEKKERNREITKHFYDTKRENMSHHSP